MYRTTLQPSDIVSVAMRMATDDDKHLPAYDNTKLVALNTCPTDAILRYSMHKVMHDPGGSRSMPLEMGSAAHEVFAAVRLWQLRETQQHVALADYHGPRLFGKPRYDAMLAAIDTTADSRSQCIGFCLTALETSGFYDDPSDKRRTYTNLEEACIAYIDRWDWNRQPVWIRDSSDPHSDIGVELPFDLVLTYTMKDGSRMEYRFIGKCDGLHVMRDDITDVRLHENKTAARLDDSWRGSFKLSSQVTGYMLALSVFTGASISHGDVFGMTVPLPRSGTEYGGIIREPVIRYTHHFERWFFWFLSTVLVDQAYKDNVYDAPKFTHSCNRYFRMCSNVPFCDSDDAEQRVIVSEMYDHEWSPLHEVNGGGD